MTKDEAVQRYKVAFQDEHGEPPFGDDAYIASSHAAAIRALMAADKPLPVDPDLLLARKIVADEYERDGMAGCAAEALAGAYDGGRSARIALAGIKAGKAMR